MREQIIETIKKHKKMVDALESQGVDIIKNVAQTIIRSIENGGTIYLCGNGGSAADCQHIAGELIGRFVRERKALPAVALSTDTSVMTSVGNDYGFDDIFARQVDGLVKKNDCLWAFSTSGSSTNIIKAVELAKKRGAKIVAFTGKKHSELEKIADVCLCADAEKSFGSQEIHQIAYHIICGLVEKHFAEGK